MIHVVGIVVVVALSAAPADAEFFESKVRPILAGVRVRCHGPKKASGGLRLDSREALIRVGESGPAVALEHPEESLVLQAVRRLDDVSAMPPDKPLAAGAVADLRRWVEAGAPWPEQVGAIQAAHHWAFEPVRAVAPPPIPARTPIDAFLASIQRSIGLSPVAPETRNRPGYESLFLKRPQWDFSKHGASGIEVSTLFPHLAGCVDDIALIRLMGLDHTRLTYRHAGRDYRLTDVHGRVVREVNG